MAAEQSLDSYNKFLSNYKRYDSIVTSLVGKEDYTIEELKKLKVQKKSTNDTACKFMTISIKRGLEKENLKEIEEYLNNRLDYHYNTEFVPREVIGDDEYEWTDDAYGNSDVKGDDPSHGTMVSGVIAGVRNNNIGVNGIADNVKIMAIRTVPDGDEWDKDVARAIKYAIDNDADIINMSFGKSFSPQKEFVDNIVKLADENNVLLIHAAGNDSKNIDIEDNFPNKFSPEEEILANNWLTIGASAISTKKKSFVADFSNYGKSNVDVFAPGNDMVLCAPDSKYEIASGTSFAAPVVSGVAALIKSYYPELTAAEIKDIIVQSAVTKDYKVKLPGTEGKQKEIVQFSTLSATGGLVNVYDALVLAEQKAKK
jgi:subtilisin family serine protease